MSKYHVIGVMSGSSLDGLDVAYCIFSNTSNEWRYEIAKAETFPFSDEIIERLQRAHQMQAIDFMKLDADFGRLVGKTVNHFIKENKLDNIDFIASHGHTIFHHPEKQFTTQIGDGAAIAAEVGYPIVNQFRTMDLALGGQGAPVVPIGEKFLFKEHTTFLNIGGIANISFHTQKTR